LVPSEQGVAPNTSQVQAQRQQWRGALDFNGMPQGVTFSQSSSGGAAALDVTGLGENGFY